MSNHPTLFDVLDVTDPNAPKHTKVTIPPWFTPTKTNKGQTLHVVNGRHPMGHELLDEDEGETCGSCSWLYRNRQASKTFLKCSLVAMTKGPATDVRSKWPACEAWEPQEGEP